MLGKQAKIVSPDTLRRMPIIHVKPVSPSATPSSVLLSVKAGLRACEIARHVDVKHFGN